MFYTGDPELKALEQRNLKLRREAFAALSRAAGNGLIALGGRLRRPRPRPASPSRPCGGDRPDPGVAH